MQKVKMSRKGQVVIPAEIRRKLKLKDSEPLFIEEDQGVIKLKPKVKLRSLCGTWPDLDIESITKEIIEDREQDATIEKKREKQIQIQEMRRKNTTFADAIDEGKLLGISSVVSLTEMIKNLGKKDEERMKITIQELKSSEILLVNVTQTIAERAGELRLKI